MPSPSVHPANYSCPVSTTAGVAFEFTLQGQAISEAPAVGNTIAAETQSSETQFWLVQVTDVECPLPAHYSFPVSAMADVVFEFTRDCTLFPQLEAQTRHVSLGLMISYRCFRSLTTWLAPGAFLRCTSKDHSCGAAELGPPFLARAASR